MSRPVPSRSRRVRAGRLMFLVVVGLLLTGCNFIDSLRNPELNATDDRVRAILTAMEEGTHLVDQEIVCLWGKGSRFGCGPGEFEVLLTGITKWAHKKNVQKGIDSWEIVERRRDPDSVDFVYYYHLKINGKNAYIWVEFRGPMDWASKKDMPAAPAEGA